MAVGSLLQTIPCGVSSENTIYGDDRLQGSLARIRSPEMALKTTFIATRVSSTNTGTRPHWGPRFSFLIASFCD